MSRFVTLYGMEHPEASLDFIYELTQRMTGEFAIRPLLERYPHIVWPRLAEWCEDRSFHVRRLVSEALRPDHQWQEKLRSLAQDPTPIIRMLARLKDDPSGYVRLSVAATLSDLAGSHPELLLNTLRQWLPVTRGETGKSLISHVLHKMVNDGNPAALAMLGYKTPNLILRGYEISPQRVQPGEQLKMELDLFNNSGQTQSLLIGYRLGWLRPDDTYLAATYKWGQMEAPAFTNILATHLHPFEKLNLLRYASGRHRIELIINGKTLATRHFTLDV